MNGICYYWLVSLQGPQPPYALGRSSMASAAFVMPLAWLVRARLPIAKGIFDCLQRTDLPPLAIPQGIHLRAHCLRKTVLTGFARQRPEHL